MSKVLNKGAHGGGAPIYNKTDEHKSITNREAQETEKHKKTNTPDTPNGPCGVGGFVATFSAKVTIGWTRNNDSLE